MHPCASTTLGLTSGHCTCYLLLFPAPFPAGTPAYAPREHHYSTLCALNAWKSGMSMEKAHAPWLKATQYKCGQGPANMTAHTPVPLCLRLTRPQGRTTSFSAEELPWGPKGLAPPRHMLSMLDQLRGPVPLNPARRPAVKAKNIGESKSHLGNS
jgi:hypothetical protein